MRKMWLLLTLVLIYGCGPRPYRIRYGPGGVPDIDKPLLQKMKVTDFDPTFTPGGLEFAYRMAFVEFDDRGEMFERAQLNEALKMIEATKEAARTRNKRAVVAVFVHGWKNNASEKAGNVWGFRQMLAGLSLQYDSPLKGSASEDPVVAGVYIGWRGAVLNVPLLKEFTFWDRRDKSQNLPNAHMIDTLLRILQTAKGPDYTDTNVVSALIGHSFGGGLLESALTQTMQNVILQTPVGQTIRWPANLVVFLNEASQATQSYQLVESMLEHVEHRTDDGMGQGPVLLSISSTGDIATRAAFPLVQAVSRPTQSLRTYPRPNALGFTRQLPMYLNTTAHRKEFHSHVITAGTPTMTLPSPAACSAVACLNVRSSIGTAGAPQFLTFTIDAIKTTKNLTPYWVMQMPASIVPDHSTIFRVEFRQLLISFLESMAPREGAPLLTTNYKRR